MEEEVEDYKAALKFTHGGGGIAHCIVGEPYPTAGAIAAAREHVPEMYESV